MSNGDTSVKVSSEGAFHLRLALELSLIYHTGPSSFGGEKKRGVDFYIVHEGGIYFGWGTPEGVIPLPVRTDVDALVPLIMSWLDGQEYGEAPDIDGSVKKGWSLVSHYSLMPDIGQRFYLNFGVKPEWMEYHK